MYEGQCRRSMVVYELQHATTKKSYVGKTQCHLKTRTKQHVYDVWKVIETGRRNFGENWYGSGSYARADAFSKHFSNLCRDCSSSNEVRAKMKKIMIPTILWQGDRIRCMKSSRTLQCNICMVERKEILSRFRTNRSDIINDNSDIFSSCKCNSRFHKFSRKVTPTLKKRLTQKKANSTQNSKQKRKKRFSFNNLNSPRTCIQVTPNSPDMSIMSADISLMSPPTGPPILYNTNVPGLPYRSPTANPSNLEYAQVRHYLDMIPNMEV